MTDDMQRARELLAAEFRNIAEIGGYQTQVVEGDHHAPVVTFPPEEGKRLVDQHHCSRGIASPVRHAAPGSCARLRDLRTAPRRTCA